MYAHRHTYMYTHLTNFHSLPLLPLWTLAFFSLCEIYCQISLLHKLNPIVFYFIYVTKMRSSPESQTHSKLDATNIY